MNQDLNNQNAPILLAELEFPPKICLEANLLSPLLTNFYMIKHKYHRTYFSLKQFLTVD